MLLQIDLNVFKEGWESTNSYGDECGDKRVHLILKVPIYSSESPVGKPSNCQPKLNALVVTCKNLCNLEV